MSPLGKRYEIGGRLWTVASVHYSAKPWVWIVLASDTKVQARFPVASLGNFL